jgi:hypothetical protein
MVRPFYNYLETKQHAYTKNSRIDGDIWDAPDGHVGISFDDGPEAVRLSYFVFVFYSQPQEGHGGPA